MAKNCFVEKEAGNYARLVNTSGAAVVAGEFCIIGDRAAIAQEAIASGAAGGFLVGGEVVIQTSTLHATNNAFATANATVFWDNTLKVFSDTTGSGLFKVGIVADIKSNGVIRILKNDNAVAV